MPNQEFKIIYSLRLHLALKNLGFAPIEQMQNPNRPGLTCWVYEITPQLLESIDAYMRGRVEK